MKRKEVFAHFGCSTIVDNNIPEELALKCEEITGIYPVDKEELKNAMLLHDISLLVL